MVDHKEKHGKVAQTKSFSATTTYHIVEIGDYTVSSKEGTVHPTAPLLYENCKIWRGVRHSFAIRNVSQVVF